MSRSDLTLHKTTTPVLSEKNASPSFLLQEELNRLFNGFMTAAPFAGWNRVWEKAIGTAPAVDVLENDKDFKIMAEVPGMNLKDVDITASDGNIIIRGEKKEDIKEEKPGYYRRERSYGEFQRVITLPDSANVEKAEASMNKGVLTISVPKKASAMPKEHKIEIKQAA